MELFILSFVAGILTVLAPCVLPLLPVIISSSVSGNSKFKPYLVILGLLFSITLFTILLKASTLLINIDPLFWKIISGGIVTLFGLIYIFPNIWTKITASFGFSSKSDKLLEEASNKKGWIGDMLIGGALGPVFASCSPTYSLIIATILPVSFIAGIGYILVYSLGLGSIMLAIALAGRGLINKLKFASNPNGWFKKTLGVLFLIVGVSIMTGFDKIVETNIINSNNFFDITAVEQKILEKNMPTSNPTNLNTNQTKGIPNSSDLENSSQKTLNLAPNMTQSTLSNFDGKATISELNVQIPYPAPEIVGIDQWINSNGETLAKLKGKVVLIDFWTYSCINCQRVLPYVNSWYDKYKSQGFEVIGVHAPEFSYEQKKENVEAAVLERKIKYPVGLDNDFTTWNAFNNRFWPAMYLIDKEGNVRKTHFGENEYLQTEIAIQFLLKE